MRGKEGCGQPVESHQDPTEWGRENISGQNQKCTCGREEAGYCDGRGAHLVRREATNQHMPSTTAWENVEQWKCQSAVLH